MSARLAAGIVIMLWAGMNSSHAQTPAALDYADLPGWESDDHLTALAAFQRSCSAPSLGVTTQEGRSIEPLLLEICTQAQSIDGAPDRNAAKVFFERWFRPAVVEEPGFLTAYFEPVVTGARVPSGSRTTPLRTMPAGSEALPERAAIEDGALDDRTTALVFLDPVDAFFAQIQGSVRVRIEDGKELRVAYAGRNEHPYTPIGRLLVEQGELARENVTMDAIIAWLRANPDEGRALMRQNKSYIFFRIDENLRPQDGPVGGSGVPLTAGRSLAIDRSHWPYGLPVWIDAELPVGEQGAAVPVRRLTIAQDTGSAIVGRARADLFLGSGEQAGQMAGRIRHPMRMIVLLPRSAS